MTFGDPVDKIEEKVLNYVDEPSFGQFQTISSAYAQTVMTELSTKVFGMLTYGEHKGSSSDQCNFGAASASADIEGTLLNGNSASFTDDQKKSDYSWTATTIESTYQYWSRSINPDQSSCPMTGYLVWGSSDSNWADRKRWAIIYKPDGNNFVKCPSTGYARSLTADLTGTTSGTCDLSDSDYLNAPFCNCGNCNNGGTDGSGYCVVYQYYTGWQQGSTEYGMYDDSDNLQSWSSYTGPGSVDSTSGSATALDITIGSGVSTTYNLDIDGSFTTASVDYDTSILDFFEVTNGNRLVIPDIGIQGSYPASTDFVVIPDNLFASDHGCDSVLVDAYEWFTGSQSTIVEAGNIFNGVSAACSDGVGTQNFCTDNHAKCLNNTLNNWLTWGQLDRNDIAFPGFDMLNIGGSYTSRITIASDTAPASRAMYSEDPIDLTLNYGFNNVDGHSLTLAQSALTFKEPAVGTITAVDNANWKTTSTHLEVDLDITNSGDASGDFFYTVSCDSGTTNHPTFTSASTTIAAGATATISTSIPGPDCLANDHSNLNDYTITISYTTLPLWSTPTTQSKTVTPYTDPTIAPTTDMPTLSPSGTPSVTPSLAPVTSAPTESPTTPHPSELPTSSIPSASPVTTTGAPTTQTAMPSTTPTVAPVTSDPTCNPTTSPITGEPTLSPSPSDPSINPTPIPVQADPSCNPTTSTSASPTGPLSVGPSTSPTVYVGDPNCSNDAMYEVTSGSGNVLAHQPTCIDRPQGSYVIDLDTSTIYIVHTYSAVDEDDEEQHTAIYNCNQDTGVQTSSANAPALAGHFITFVSNWAETVAYFGSVYDPEDPPSVTVRVRLGSFALTDYPEGSSERADLEANILSGVCAMNTGAECSQFSISNLVSGSIIAVLNIDGTDNDATKLIDIQKNLQNEVASYTSDPNATPDASNPLASIDRFYWNNKQYAVIFTYCPSNQYITLGSDETTATLTWTEPTAEWANGGAAAPERLEGADIANGSEQPVGTYFFRYTAQENGEHAPPCTFFIQVTSDEEPESTTESIVEWMTNEAMLIGAIAASIVGICTFVACWRKFGVTYDKEGGDFTSPMPKEKRGKKTKVVVRDLESSSDDA
jgi:hypothetical protein